MVVLFVSFRCLLLALFKKNVGHRPCNFLTNQQPTDYELRTSMSMSIKGDLDTNLELLRLQNKNCWKTRWIAIVQEESLSSCSMCGGVRKYTSSEMNNSEVWKTHCHCVHHYMYLCCIFVRIIDRSYGELVVCFSVRCCVIVFWMCEKVGVFWSDSWVEV